MNNNFANLDLLESEFGNRDSYKQDNRKQQEEKKDEVEVDLYDPSIVLPENMIKVSQISAKTLWDLISSQLRESIPDYYGCNFIATNQGYKFMMAFKENANSNTRGVLKCLEPTLKDTGNRMQNYIERTQANSNRRHVYKFTEDAKKFFGEFIDTGYNNKYQKNKITWDKLISERSFRRNSSPFNMGNEEYYLILEGLDLNLIIDNLFTPTEEKNTLKEKAKKLSNENGRSISFNMSRLKNIRYRAEIKGFIYTNTDGMPFYSLVPLTYINGGYFPTMADPVSMRNNKIDMDTFMINIYTMDVRVIKKNVPKHYEMSDSLNFY